NNAASDFELSRNDWERLKLWLRYEPLQLQEFRDALAVLNAQQSDRKDADANAFLAEMLNPTSTSSYAWLRRQPDKRRAILETFSNAGMGRAAVAVAESEDESETMRVAALNYLMAIRYQEGTDRVVRIARRIDSGPIHVSALVAAAALRPSNPEVIELMR